MPVERHKLTARITFDGSVFRASPWRGPAPSGGWSEAFQVRTSADDAPAMMGVYALDGETLCFTPRFPPSPGLTLRATFRAEDGAEIVSTFAGMAVEDTAPTHVAAIYPSTDVWPANILKFYIHFSAPMAIGDAWKRVRFRDEAGEIVEGSFVEIDQELWDREGKRLTILFDPGRIKRGLKDNESEGTPFISGKRYTLEIDAGWKDANGRPLTEGARKTIRVGAEARVPVDPTRWVLETPRGAHEPLVLCFPRPLDHALALRAIVILREDAVIEGAYALEQEEKRLLFTPAQAWVKGRHEIVVNGILEDLAGNKPGRLFDVDTSDPNQARVGAPEMRISFTVA